MPPSTPTDRDVPVGVPERPEQRRLAVDLDDAPLPDVAGRLGENPEG
jgi:hypothetical protein